MTKDQSQTAQAVLPALEELPDYHGRKPVGMKTTLNGTGNRISRTHEIGDSIVLVIECKVRTAGHEETDDGLQYCEGYKVKDLFELPADQGKLLINGLRQSYKSAEGSARGEKRLPGVDDTELAAGAQVVTDAAGIVLTPSELEELHGITLDHGLDPVVLVFADGSRGLWPDDWAGLNQSRGSLGGTMRRPGSTTPGDVLQIVEILHHDTGESLERWTDEQENDRLLALEEDAAEEERLNAIADREAAEELEAGRTPDAAPEWSAEEDRRRLRVILGTVLELDDGATFLDDVAGARALLDAEPADMTPAIIERLTPEVVKELADLVERLETPGPFDGEPAEDLLPTAEDFAFVDCKEDELRPKLDEVTDHARALRLLKAEEQGRGRGLKPRKGILERLEKHAQSLYLAEPVAPADLPGAGYDVPDDALEVEEDPEPGAE